MVFASVAVVPPQEFQGQLREDGKLRADAYWHGEILEMRRRHNLKQVCQ